MWIYAVQQTVYSSSLVILTATSVSTACNKELPGRMFLWQILTRLVLGTRFCYWKSLAKEVGRSTWIRRAAACPPSLGRTPPASTWSMPRPHVRFGELFRVAVPLRQTWCHLGKCFEKRTVESQSSAYGIEIELKKASTGSWKCWALRDCSNG